MLIALQKFRSCMIGHYNRSCHIIMRNTHKMWGLFYSCTMRTVPMSCHVTTCAVTSCAHITQHAHTDKPAALLIYIQELLMDMPCMQAEQHLSKITTSHFSTLNTKIANQNVLRRILIAMHNENKADCNENLRICAEDIQSELTNAYIERERVPHTTVSPKGHGVVVVIFPTMVVYPPQLHTTTLCSCVT